jgi:hypothetical protein
VGRNRVSKSDIDNWQTCFDAAVDDLSSARTNLGSCVTPEDIEACTLSASISTIQQYLSDSDVVLDFFKYANRYAVWVVKRAGVVRIELGPAAPIDDSVKAFQRVIAFRGLVGSEVRADEVDSGKRLSALIRAAISPHISDAQFIYIVPDGSLNDLPFGALTDESELTLVDTHNLAYLFSIQELVPWPNQPPTREGVVLIALSRFDGSPGVRRFYGIPSVHREVNIISEICGNAKILINEAATDTAVKNEAPRARILHFATHGITVPRVSFRNIAADVLADPKAYIRRIGEAYDPMQNSALVFWNSIFTARDLSYLDLDGADLVILSLSAGSPLAWPGEGAPGLARALIEAGVRNVIITPQLPDDLTTSEFWTDLYRRLVQGLSPAEAMRNAVLDLKKRRPDPWYWANFAVHGRCS